MCLSRLPVTTLSFLTWREASGNTVDELPVCDLCPITLMVAPPSNLVAIAVDDERIDLSWDDNTTQNTAYQIERSLTSGSGFVVIASIGPNATSYSDLGLTPETTYYYRVKASGPMDSDYSNEASATTLFAFEFNTSILPSLLSPFDPSVTYTGLATGVKWRFQNNTEIVGTSLNITDGTTNGLDGSNQPVKLLLADKLLLTGLQLNKDDITGSLDVSPLPNLDTLGLADNLLIGFT